MQLTIIYSNSDNSSFNINDLRNLNFQIQEKLLVFMSFYQFDENLTDIFNNNDAIEEMDSPLFVVLLNQDEAKYVLMLIEKIQLINRSIKWLIFVYYKYDYEELNQSIYIPFDTEVFIVPHFDEDNINTVTVLEIFQKTSNQSIEINIFGEWNINYGLKSKFVETSLNYRRNLLG